jgi:hypothetical protein
MRTSILCDFFRSLQSHYIEVRLYSKNFTNTTLIPNLQPKNQHKFRISNLKFQNPVKSNSNKQFPTQKPTHIALSIPSVCVPSDLQAKKSSHTLQNEKNKDERFPLFLLIFHIEIFHTNLSLFQTSKARIVQRVSSYQDMSKKPYLPHIYATISRDFNKPFSKSCYSLKFSYLFLKKF